VDDEILDRLGKAIREVPVSEVGAARIRRYGTDYLRGLLEFYEEVQRISRESGGR